MNFAISTPMRIGLCIVLGIIFIVAFVSRKSDSGARRLAYQIYGVLDKYQITYDIDAASVEPSFDTRPQQIIGKEVVIQQIEQFVVRNAPIKILLVGFPFKSANHDKKTIGYLPDLAERKSLDYLQEMLTNINRLYRSGVQLTIFCDGIPFAEFFKIPFNHVLAYEQHLIKLASDLPDIQLYTSVNFMTDHNLTNLSDINRVIDSYAPSNQEFEKNMPPVVGIARKRFALELNYPQGQEILRKQSLDKIVFGLLAREARLRNYLVRRFPAEEYLRFTVHFSADSSKKFGIKLSPDSNITPYHGVLVLEADGSWKIKFKKDIDLNRYKRSTVTINEIDCAFYISIDSRIKHENEPNN